MTVLDSSGAVDLLLGVGVAEEVVRLLDAERELAAPDVIVFEILSVLRREVARGLDPWPARRAVEGISDLALDLYASGPLSQRAWALRSNFTMGDALFVALAEKLGEPLATKDVALATEAPKHADVEARLLGAAG